MMRILPPRYVRGQIILLALIFAGIFAMVSTALVRHITSYGRLERTTVAAAEAFALAEGALDEAAYQLNHNPSYTGETDTPLGDGVFSITIATVASTTRRVDATGYVPDSQNPVAIKTIKATIESGTGGTWSFVPGTYSIAR